MAKICSKCSKEKELKEFYKDGTKYRSDCIECFNKRRRQKCKTDPEWRAKVNKACREWYHDRCKTNPEWVQKENKRKMKYYYDTLDVRREKYRIRDRRYGQNNPDKIRDKARKRRARKLNAEGSHTTQQFRWLYAEFNCVCLNCKRKFRFKDITEDHIIPLSKGGSDWIENIQPLCQSCNSSKGTKTINFKEK